MAALTTSLQLRTPGQATVCRGASASSAAAFGSVQAPVAAFKSLSLGSASSIRGKALVAQTFQPARAVKTFAIRAEGDASSDDAPEDEGSRGGRGAGRGGRGRGRGGRGRGRGRREENEFEERVVQVQRVTKVVKGGKLMSFRATVVVGDGKSRVGVGCAKAREVVQAVTKASVEAKREMINVKVNKHFTIPHRVTGNAGSAQVMLRPAAEGTGVLAGSSVRVVLELAGVKNVLGKELGSPNPLNNARAVIDGLSQLRTFKEVSEMRGIPMEDLWGTVAASSAGGSKASST